MTNKNSEKLQIRLTEYEKNRIKWLADKYANGNMSLYLIYAALNIDRRKIRPDDVKGFSKRKGGTRPPSKYPKQLLG
ncbi:hypothetical protein KAR91_40785 [Candidatus Pacearchaeota archaeon]|nr:hypothetical protein [Candidatus Pacearchaeota archaeon]